MKGDFSKMSWELAPVQTDNDNGVLYQQGRVILDADGNAQTGILTRWQESAARDIIGAGVVAVPLESEPRFGLVGAEPVRITSSDGATVITVDLSPGQVWVDGLLLRLASPPRIATPMGSPAPLAQGDREALLLEVWRESVSAFQRPGDLLEPALGGPDTSARLHSFAALRLLRIEPDGDCNSLGDALTAGVDSTGTLSVTLADPNPGTEDCPTPAGGGYRGFEHHVYRVEIADVDVGGQASFKWSRFNGGLVGRGRFDGGRVAITHNLSAILTCGLSTFYLEVLEESAAHGYWRVIYGAEVTLDSETQSLVLPDMPELGAAPDGGADHFFRLWDGIKPIADFADAGGVHLEDGIYLALHDDVETYSPGDYWSFELRAGGIGNSQTLIDAQPPVGVVRHRAPLALLTWQVLPSVTPSVSELIPCSRVFPSLTRRTDCCTIRVGDGRSSQGDCQSIQQAVDQLIALGGGRVCLLPGTFTENVLIDRGHDILIEGCGEQTRLIGQPPAADRARAALHLRDSQRVRVRDFRIIADETAPAVLLEGVSGALVEGGIDISDPHLLRDVVLEGLRIEAGPFCAIDAHHCADIRILGCRLAMRDIAGPWPALYFQGEDGLIQGNLIRVEPEGQAPFLEHQSIAASAGLGGIQLGGTCEQVRVIDNRIQGGIGHGITLGSLVLLDPNGGLSDQRIGWPESRRNPCFPCWGGLPYEGDEGSGPLRQAAGALRALTIQDNRILDMGLSGISVVGFFAAARRDAVLVTDLTIRGNLIRGNLRGLGWSGLEIPADWLTRIAFGGIALADVDGLVVDDNRIEDNGPTRLQPVCGLFVRHVGDATITGNRIVNNGARGGEPDASARPGLRGGVVLLLCTPGSSALTETRQQQREARSISKPQPFTAPSPAPSLRMHGNLVSAPLGRALTAGIVGTAQIECNQLISSGLAPGTSFITSSQLAATVGVLGLGPLTGIGSGQLKGHDTEMYRQVQLSKPELDRIRGDPVAAEQSMTGLS